MWQTTTRVIVRVCCSLPATLYGAWVFRDGRSRANSPLSSSVRFHTQSKILFYFAFEVTGPFLLSNADDGVVGATIAVFHNRSLGLARFLSLRACPFPTNPQPASTFASVDKDAMGNCVSAEEAPQAAAQQETSSKAAPIEEVAATTTPQGGEATTEPQEAVAEAAAEPAELEEGASAEEANEEEKEVFSTPAPAVVAAPVAEDEEKGTPPPAKVAAAPEEDDMETPCKVIITNQSKKLNIYPQVRTRRGPSLFLA